MPRFHCADTTPVPPASLRGRKDLSGEFAKQRLRLLEVRSVEPLGEPPVDLREQRDGLLAMSLLVEQSCETHRRAQLGRLRVHLLRQFDRFAEVSLGEVEPRRSICVSAEAELAAQVER